MRFFTLSKTFSRTWLRVGAKLAREVPAAGSKIASKERSPSRKAAKPVASRLPAGYVLSPTVHADFSSMKRRPRWVVAAASVGFSMRRSFGLSASAS